MYKDLIGLSEISQELPMINLYVRYFNLILVCHGRLHLEPETGQENVLNKFSVRICILSQMYVNTLYL